jgi:hypothetical protein
MPPIKRSSFVLVLVLSLCWCSLAVAENADESAVAATPGAGWGSVPTLQGVPALNGLLFVGTATNVNDPAATLNDVFTVDPVADTSATALMGVQVWGATADYANQRVLFTRASGLTPPAGQIGGGDELFAVPFSGGAPVSLGRITDPLGGFRVDGLAISGGVLYAVNAGATAQNGFYSIDLGTLEATEIALFADSIGGLDADPDTGVIYGSDDTTGMLVTISTSGTISNVAAYPGGFVDIDGVAVGGGLVYLVTDEAGTFPVYDIGAASYSTSLTSPFTSADTFSGAAFVLAVDLMPIFMDGFESGDISAWGP